MAIFKEYLIMTPAPSIYHYHRVDVFLWRDVRGLLERLAVDALVSRPAPVALCLDDSALDGLVEFLSQMETSYLHPRRSSAIFRLSSPRRVAPVSVPAYPRMKKNLSPNDKENATVRL